MEKKTWNHININEKVMTVPYIQFKENEEIVESINDRKRKRKSKTRKFRRNIK